MRHVIVLVLCVMAAALPCRGQADGASPWPPPGWQRVPVGEAGSITVTLLAARRTTAIDDAFLGIELTNRSEATVTVRSLTCQLWGSTLDLATGRPFDATISLGSVSLTSQDNARAIPHSLGPRETTVARLESTSVAARLGIPGLSRVVDSGKPPRPHRRLLALPAGGLRVEASVVIDVVTAGAASSRLPSVPAEFTFDWAPPEPGDVTVLMSRVSEMLHHPPARALSHDAIDDWLAIPELAASVPVADMLAGLAARSTGYVTTALPFAILDVLRARPTDRVAVTAFLRDRLERGSPDAVAWLGHAPELWDDGFRPAVERLARSGLVPEARRLLLDHRPLAGVHPSASHMLLPIELPVLAEPMVVGALADVSGDALSGWLLETPEPARNAPVLAGGVVLFLTADMSLWAVDSTSGAERWRRRLRVDEIDVPAFVLADRRGGLPPNAFAPTR